MKPSLDLKPGDVIDRFGVRCRVLSVILAWHPIIGPCVRVEHSPGIGLQENRATVNYSPFARVKLA